MDMRTVVTMRELQYIHIVRTDKATASHVCMLRARPPARPHARMASDIDTGSCIPPHTYIQYVHIDSLPPKSEGGAPRLGTYIHTYLHTQASSVRPT